MQFPSIDIQGSILSADLLGKIRTEQADYQSGKNFNTEFNNPKLKEEISLAWQEAKGQWAIFQSKLKRVKDGDTGTTETRNFWILPILSSLGYNLNYSREAEVLAGKTFPISYKDLTLKQFPIHVCGYNESLDKRPESKQLRVSPHAMLQEYLNYSEQLYGLVTNGKQLRLLRDASRLTRLSYVEFNLEKMMEEDLYSDFVILYRLIHASRMKAPVDGGEQIIMEIYHQQSLEAGATIRNELGRAVKQVIIDLANGLINHPDNIEFREFIAKSIADDKTGKFDQEEYYRQLLRVIYRMLFLFVIEERNLVYAESKQPELRRFSKIYFGNYSLMRLRKLARHLPPPDADRHHDLWLSLLSTFAIFETRYTGEKMGIMALQGDLFAYDAIANGYYDFHKLHISNAVLLKMMRNLTYFENESKVLVAVNYGGLDVEEFGSVYEGLLELKLNIVPIPGATQLSCSFDASNERSKSGSHYTPEELVQPLIKHSLDYLIEDRVKPYQEKKASKEQTVKDLLGLKICDVACGSGHILLSAARRVAIEIARIQTDEDQPNPMATRKALREVIRNCIYGVDKNPLAIELCKIAFWLEAHNPGEPLNFLDHHIKCGDAIVGLAHKEELQKPIPEEAFKALPGDDGSIASSLKKKNKDETAGQIGFDFEGVVSQPMDNLSELFKSFEVLPETTPEEIDAKEKAYKKLTSGTNWWRLKTLADVQVAQFFIPKTAAKKDVLTTTGNFRQYLKGQKAMQDLRISEATTIANERRFFHWFLEFPEVFAKDGFDCILGNPPYLGWSGLSEISDDRFLEFISKYYSTSKKCDFATYFILRIGSIINTQAIFNVITTNSISQGDTRRFGLEQLLASKLFLSYAYPNIKWTGSANVVVTLVGGSYSAKISRFIQDKKVDYINSYLTETIEDDPSLLYENKNHSFIGHVIYGDGFLVNKEKVQQIDISHPVENKIIYPYITGSDAYSNFDQKSDRYVIYFNEMSENEARCYPLCFEIIEENVKPYRIVQDSNKYPRMVNEWWKFWANRIELNKKIENNFGVLVQTRVSKTHAFVFLNNKQIFSDSLVIFDFNSFYFFAILQSTFHELWAWKYCSTMKNDRRYSPTDCFENYPFPQNKMNNSKQLLTTLGEQYHEFRKQFMQNVKIGLTKTYNTFHSNSITITGVDDKEKLVISLQKHLDKTDGTISFAEGVQGIIKLRELHVEMDNAVLEAYGWQDIQLRHDFYEVDYLPENDRTRYTIHPDARKEVLKRLLELNHKIRKDEEDQGLWDGKGSASPAGGKGGGKKSGGKVKIKDDNQSELF